MSRTPLDLSSEAQVTFGQVIFDIERSNPGKSFDECYLAACDVWELDCPHLHQIPYGGGSKCVVCGTVTVSSEEDP